MFTLLQTSVLKLFIKILVKNKCFIFVFFLFLKMVAFNEKDIHKLLLVSKDVFLEVV